MTVARGSPPEEASIRGPKRVAAPLALQKPQPHPFYASTTGGTQIARISLIDNRCATNENKTHEPKKPSKWKNAEREYIRSSSSVRNRAKIRRILLIIIDTPKAPAM